MSKQINIQCAVMSPEKSYFKNNSQFVCINLIIVTIFVTNKTHHASHLNSAPGWVFDFYGGHLS
jgi:hypothetical protein